MQEPVTPYQDTDDVHRILLGGWYIKQRNKTKSIIIDAVGDLDPHFLIRVLSRNGVLS